MPSSSITYVLEQIEKTGILILPISTAHILRTETLAQHHGDPFDRMIIAQAIEEELTILSADTEIPKYPVEVIWR